MKTTLVQASLWLGLFAASAGAQTPLPFSDGKWQLRGEKTAVETADGRETLRFETGMAVRSDAAFQDGTIDLDVQFTRRRSFVYLIFRMEGDGEYEEIYLRPHKSGLPDAIQYAPVFQGQSAWQFFHGPGGTASPEYEHGAWTHVRLVVKGTQAVVFVGDMRTPVLVIPRLGRVPRPGAIALRGFLPAGVPGSGAIARYANVTMQRDVVPYDFSTLRVPDDAEPGVIHAWRVGRAAKTEEGDYSASPERLLAGPSRVIEADPSGRLLLHREIRMPAGVRDVTTAASVRIRAEAAGTRRLDLGFSDAVTVFLNGQPLFRGDAHYSFDQPRQEGLIGYGQSGVFLPLKAGDNELVVIVSDSFGGWGLMGRIIDRRGLVIEPSPGS